MSSLSHNELTHWGWVTHICVGKLTIIGSDNGLSPGRRQAIIWANAGILLIGPLGTNFSEILIEIRTFSFKKMHLKVSSAKRRPFCLGLNLLTHWPHGRWWRNVESIIFKFLIQNISWGAYFEIAIRWMLQNHMASLGHNELTTWITMIWVRSQNCRCLVTWFCYQLIAKPGNRTATVLWPYPYPHAGMTQPLMHWNVNIYWCI